MHHWHECNVHVRCSIGAKCKTMKIHFHHENCEWQKPLKMNVFSVIVAHHLVHLFRCSCVVHASVSVAPVASMSSQTWHTQYMHTCNGTDTRQMGLGTLNISENNEISFESQRTHPPSLTVAGAFWRNAQKTENSIKEKRAIEHYVIVRCALSVCVCAWWMQRMLTICKWCVYVVWHLLLPLPRISMTQRKNKEIPLLFLFRESLESRFWTTTAMTVTTLKKII